MKIVCLYYYEAKLLHQYNCILSVSWIWNVSTSIMASLLWDGQDFLNTFVIDTFFSFLFFSTLSVDSPLFLPLIFVPRWQRYLSLLLLSSAVCFSPPPCFPYSAMRDNMVGQRRNPRFAVTCASQVQTQFNLTDFTLLMQKHRYGFICAFQVNIWRNVEMDVRLSVHLVRVNGTRTTTTYSWAASFVKSAKDVSNFIAFWLKYKVWVRAKLCDFPTFRPFRYKQPYLIFDVLFSLRPMFSTPYNPSEIQWWKMDGRTFLFDSTIPCNSIAKRANSYSCRTFEHYFTNLLCKDT